MSELLFGIHVISSSTGFQQGDPIAGLMFALVLHPIIELLLERVPGLKLNSWFHDDGTLAGTPQQLRDTLDLITEEGPPHGLILSTARTVTDPNRAKTTI